MASLKSIRLPWYAKITGSTGPRVVIRSEGWGVLEYSLRVDLSLLGRLALLGIRLLAVARRWLDL